MDQGLKYMVGLYVGIFLIVGLFAFSTERPQDAGADMAGDVPDRLSADQHEELLLAEIADAVDPNLNVIQFESSRYQTSAQTGFATLIKKTDISESSSLDSHQPFNQVRFENGDQPSFEKSKSDDKSSHQAFNQVGFGLSEKVKSSEPSAHQPLNIVRFNRESQPHQAYNVVAFEKKD